MLRLNDLMPFGEHKGEEVEDLIIDHPGYMTWLHDHNGTKFDSETIVKMQEAKII